MQVRPVDALRNRVDHCAERIVEVRPRGVEFASTASVEGGEKDSASFIDPEDPAAGAVDRHPARPVQRSAAEREDSATASVEAGERDLVGVVRPVDPVGRRGGGNWEHECDRECRAAARAIQRLVSPNPARLPDTSFVIADRSFPSASLCRALEIRHEGPAAQSGGAFALVSIVRADSGGIGRRSSHQRTPGRSTERNSLHIVNARSANSAARTMR